ncbi:GNAT family N-acetyltransferase [Sulfuritalea sp.]|uniref:GNAT family N-acetyltransferase n=1 Tax=Sulfuritalea sp. TaxID=2480090 RepID=UPI00286E70F3|nr:GNAT family N-acetyltransferase [Sulfuritalea sp.]
MPTDANQPVVLFYRVRMMLAQMLVVLLATLSIFLLPLPHGYIVLTLVYGALLLAERRLSIRSPLTVGAFLLSAFVLVLNQLVEWNAYGIYVPVAYFGLLFMIGAACLLRRHPASLYYSDGYGSLALHWKTSGAWVLIYAAGLAVSLLLTLQPGLFWLLLVLPVAGVLLTLWLQLVDSGPASRRSQSFSLGSFRFEEVPPHRETLGPFYTHLMREEKPNLIQGKGVDMLSFEQQLQLRFESDAPCWSSSRFFVAYEGKEIIGTISCRMKTVSARLGVESASDLVSVDRLGEYGGVMEVGRFSIGERYRLRQDVIQGLLRSVIEYAFENDAAFLVTQALQPSIPIYTKIGFQKISERLGLLQGTRTPVLLMVFNLAKRAVCDLEDARANFRLVGALSPYLGERYFKRQSLRSIFASKRAWCIPDSALPQLCLSTLTTDSRGAPQHGA